MNQENKEYCYYWYHHMMPSDEIKAISESIQNHDFKTFINFVKKWNGYGYQNGLILDTDDDKEFYFHPIIYLPSHASYWNKEKQQMEYIDIFREKYFNQITFEECECG